MAERSKNRKKIIGLKKTCGETKRIGWIISKVQINFNTENNHIWGDALTTGNVVEYENPAIVSFATNEPLTQAEIVKYVEAAISNRKCTVEEEDAFLDAMKAFEAEGNRIENQMFENL